MENNEEKLVLALLPAPIYTKVLFWVWEALALVVAGVLAIRVHIVLGVIAFLAASIISLLHYKSAEEHRIKALVITENTVSFGYGTLVDTEWKPLSVLMGRTYDYHSHEEVKITMTVSRIESVALYQTAYEKKHNQGYIVFWGDSEHRLEKAEVSDHSEEYLEKRLPTQEKGCYTFHGIPDFDTLAERLKPFFDRVIDYT